jgi:UDP-N-acetylglucosamine:LPS N-acetylglucosamine transferase
MNKKKILVLTDDLPWGHRSIAKAIYGFLKENEKTNDYIVEYREVKANIGIGGDLYTFAYRYFPKTNKLLYNFSNRKIALDLLEEVSAINLPRLKKEVEKIKPDLIISSYFFHSYSLLRWRQRTKHNFKLWAVVPDPWTINAVSFIKDADLNLVYDETSLKEGLKYGIEKEKMMITGWWTRQSMFEKYDYKKSREKLGFKDDRPVIFIGGGSLGTNALPKLLPVILMMNKKAGFVINTGVDKFAFNLVDQFSKVLKKMRKDDLIQVKHLGWIENMAEVLSACDMIFGKAGPNFLFDCVASRKPFVAITHISGQEDGI